MTNRGFDFLYSLQKISKVKQNLFTRQTVKLEKATCKSITSTRSKVQFVFQIQMKRNKHSNLKENNVCLI